MPIDQVRAHLAQFGAADRIVEHPVSSATVDLAAEAIGTEPRRIAKTLSFSLPDGPIVVVVAGDARIDNKKYRTWFGVKAKMLNSTQVSTITGHEVGGVCPFGLNDGVRVFLDASLRRFDTVFPACGSANSSIEVTIPELEEFSGSRSWVDVTTTPNRYPIVSSCD